MHGANMKILNLLFSSFAWHDSMLYRKLLQFVTVINS